MSFEVMKGVEEIGAAFNKSVVRIYTDIKTRNFRDLSHAYVDLYVETWRASAYFIGHVLAVFVPLAIIAEILS